MMEESGDVNARRTIAADNETYTNYGSLRRNPGPYISQSIDPDIDPECMLNQEIEGLDYDFVQNKIYMKEKQVNGSYRRLNRVMTYVILFLIGVFTASSAFMYDFCIDKLSHLKFSWIRKLLEVELLKENGISSAGFAWCALNAIPVGIASILVVFVAPVAAGSGIPQIKCFLNGINVPKVNRLSTLLTKGIGVVLSVAGGLAIGKEGPMIHTGAAIAAGLSQGRLTLCKKSFSLFRVFRNDREKRDFVSAGAAAGVAAAFGAPVGGLLFALEEGASFVNQQLTWNILFCSMTSFATLAFFKSFLNLTPFKYTPGGLISFGTMDYLNSYTMLDILIFIAFGVIGGLLGSLFIKINIVITKFRKNNVNKNVTKVVESMLIAALTAAIGFTVMAYSKDCRPLSLNSMDNAVKMFCSDSEYSSAAEYFFQTPEKAVRSLLHGEPTAQTISSLLIFFPLYFMLACITYGLWVPSGLFIPTLLAGAAWGRMFGVLLYNLDQENFPEPSKFALIGAAAMLGGVVRMTVSLTVILMEATGNIIVGLPLILTLVIAKYIGDLFNEGIYDCHIELSGFALLPWHLEDMAVSKLAYDVMSSPVIYLEPVMRVGDLVDRVSNNRHHGYPVTDGEVDVQNHRYGTLFGLISLKDLTLLLDKKIFHNPEDSSTDPVLSIDDYDSAYPRYKPLKEVVDNMDPQDFQRLIDLRPFMNHAPYRVTETMSLDRVFNEFRYLGLRHLPVIDNANQIRGIITRKDISRFKFEPKDGSVHIEERFFSKMVHS